MAYSEKQQLLLNKAIEIYNQKGEVAIRELAAAAGMNVAAVNYHFGSKKRLMEEVEKYLYDSIDELVAPVEQADIPAADKLKLLLLQLIRYFLKNPGTIKYFYGVLGINNEQNYTLLSQIVDRDNPYIKLCSEIIRQETGITDPFELFCRYLLFICSLVPPFMFGMLDSETIAKLSDFMNIHLRVEDLTGEILEQYLETIVRLVLSRP